MMVNGELLVKLPTIKIEEFGAEDEYFGPDEAKILVGRIKNQLKMA